ncbi:hypothetical protein LTR70_003213 [Exophiala xenobiotica]|uniref:MYND-type domain-containing protein n=1 Tax=Lithohypha guttulata TaxID=1690604 RepID=A0ABR0KGP3_9EURO|nr:hypothetical protein LTR24_002858 [Lithohypha guttulata]KAK5323725.1 hypothetical protein LTR70_003213 [Exophiala xenobiotica]
MPFLQTIPRCEQCGQFAQQPGVSIKQCSKCHVVGYCSLDCQSSGWKAGHKFECRTPEQVNAVSRRAVSRLHFGGGSNLESKIYYLKVSRPWIQDICISGPFGTLEETFPNISRNLRFSRSGMLYFDELCPQGAVDRVAHVRAPLDADQDKEIFVEIIAAQNAELEALLPRPVYNVVWAEPAERQTRGRSGAARLESMELVGTFMWLDDAKAAVRSEVQARAAPLPAARQICEEISGEFCGAVTQHGKIRGYGQIVYDSGAMDTTSTYVNPS